MSININNIFTNKKFCLWINLNYLWINLNCLWINLNCLWINLNYLCGQIEAVCVNRINDLSKDKESNIYFSV